MEQSQIKYYQCENKNCGLRFPGYDGYPRLNRCPICRSEVNLVATIDKMDTYNQDNVSFMYPIEAMIDNVRSALNVGSIFRTSEGAGINKIHLCGISPTPDNPKVRKTALGAEVNIPWSWSANGLDAVINLQEKGYLIWALENIPGSEPLFQVSLPQKVKPILLIVGNEISGIDPGILDVANKVISIPMIGKKSSYNVAIAFGIASSFLLYRQSFSHGSRNMFPNI